VYSACRRPWSWVVPACTRWRSGRSDALCNTLRGTGHTDRSGEAPCCRRPACPNRGALEGLVGALFQLLVRGMKRPRVGLAAFPRVPRRTPPSAGRAPRSGRHAAPGSRSYACPAASAHGRGAGRSRGRVCAGRPHGNRVFGSRLTATVQRSLPTRSTAATASTRIAAIATAAHSGALVGRSRSHREGRLHQEPVNKGKAVPMIRHNRTLNYGHKDRGSRTTGLSGASPSAARAASGAGRPRSGG
jgi:hypothetical protein